ncbi:MAG TPA: FN3 associated domain-containing protein [Syntrophomonadaceae bacterium]|nr:FN3 associated domain-containing protein [Syntrophomonadaceae bacterium]
MLDLKAALRYCDNGSTGTNALTLTPGGGTYCGFQLVCLHAIVSSAGYYTLDGSDPRRSRTRQLINYHEHLCLTTSTTVKAVKYYRSIGEYGPVVAARYNIRPIPIPKFKAVSFNRALITNLPPDCEAYYTQDGSEPSRSKNAIQYDHEGVPIGPQTQVALAKTCFCGLDEDQQEPCKVMWGSTAGPNSAHIIPRQFKLRTSD